MYFDILYFKFLLRLNIYLRKKNECFFCNYKYNGQLKKMTKLLMFNPTIVMNEL